MSMVGFPLLLIPLAIYNIIVFLMPGVSFADPLLTVTLMSGAGWPVTLSDMLLALGILLLLLEIIKGARPGAKYLTDHLLSLVVFGAAAAEFLLWPRFGSSTYGLLALLALVDFLSGIALRARRGAPIAAGAMASRRAAGKSAGARPQNPCRCLSLNQFRHPHRRCRRPHLSRNRCCGITLSRRPRNPPSRSCHTLPSPEVPSPGLQPGNGSSAAPDAPPPIRRMMILVGSVWPQTRFTSPACEGRSARSDVIGAVHITCRVRSRIRSPNAGSRCRRSGHRRELRGASCGFAAPARRSRSDA